jgi:NAD-reducing hydrogenase small subunit
VLIALGDCAVFGGVPTLRNACSSAAALRRAYEETESTVDGKIPQCEEIATMQDARAVDQVVDVDVHIPGCPPSADAILYVLSELVAGRKPALKGKLLDWH